MGSALVTGATRGAGRAIACALAEAGWTVWGLGRDRHVLDELRADHGIVPFALDLTDRDELRALAGGIRPDVVIHAALRWPEAERFLATEEAEIDMAFEVNLSATLHLTRALLPAMLDAHRGAIRVVVPAPTEAASMILQMVGAATAAFARGLARELAGAGVTVGLIEAGAASDAETARAVLKDLAQAGFPAARAAADAARNM